MVHVPGAITAHTNEIAEQLAIACAGDPAAELRAWVRIAEQREAMVVTLYAEAAVRRRLPQPASEDEVARVVAQAIGSIWAQETSHTQLIGALRTIGGEHGLRFEKIMGSIEGGMVEKASARGLGGPIARWLIGLGRLVGGAPEFTREIDTMRFDQFCRFSYELEGTAALGYARMAALLDQLEQIGAAPSDLTYGVVPRYEMIKTLAEERFHAVVFDRIETWLSADGGRFVARSAQRCVRELRELAAIYLSLAHVRALQDSTEIVDRSPEPGPWISDGGLGGLFHQYGFDAPVAPPPAA